VLSAERRATDTGLGDPLWVPRESLGANSGSFRHQQRAVPGRVAPANRACLASLAHSGNTLPFQAAPCWAHCYAYLGIKDSSLSQAVESKNS
jgi:hypothetical protein